MQAVEKLTTMLEDARHAQGNPPWIDRKLEECLTEAVNRLRSFPDLRDRYIVSGLGVTTAFSHCERERLVQAVPALL